MALNSFFVRRRLAARLATRKRMRRGTLVAIGATLFLTSFLIRSLHSSDLAGVMYTNRQPFAGLVEVYDLRAASIVNGEGLLGPYDVDPAHTVWLSQAPGYSIYLSSVYRLWGRDFFRAQVVQNALNALSPVIIFLVAGSLVSWRVGIAAGILAAISHHLSHFSNFILPDSLYALPILLAAGLLALARRGGTRSRLFWVGAGLLFGLATWLRSQAMLLAPFVAVVLSAATPRRRSPIMGASLAVLTSFLVISPITIRNYVVYHEFVPVQIGLGVTLWEGIGESSGNRFGAVATDEEVARQEALIYGNAAYASSWSWPDGIRRDRDRTAKSLSIIARHPFWYAGVMLSRMGEMLKYSAHAPLVSRPSDVRPVDFGIKRGWERMASEATGPPLAGAMSWARAPVRALQRAAKETVLPVMIIGVLIMLVASPRRTVLLMTVPAYFLLFQSALHTEFRYAIPMHYFLFVFAAVTWVLLGSLAADLARRARLVRRSGWPGSRSGR